MSRNLTASTEPAESDPSDFGVAPLPLICISVSLVTFYVHLSLIVYVRDLRHMYGRFLMTAFSLHVAGTTMKLVSCFLDRPTVPKLALAPCNALVHLLELLTAAWCFGSVLLLWLEERRNHARRAAPLVRVQPSGKYLKCVAASLLFAMLFVSLGLAGSFKAKASGGGSVGGGNSTGGAGGGAMSWHGFLESGSHALDVSYFRTSLVLVYRDRNCAAPNQATLLALRPVSVAYAYVLALPSLVLYLLQAPMLVSLGRIIDAMMEERRQDSRVAINAFRVFAKFSVSSVLVQGFSLMALVLYHSCEAVCLWHIHFMLQALQTIFLCITCLFSRPSIEILMERFGAKEDTKLESGLGLLAAVMHSKRAKTLKGMRPGTAARGPTRAKYPFMMATT